MEKLFLSEISGLIFPFFPKNIGVFVPKIRPNLSLTAKRCTFSSSASSIFSAYITKPASPFEFSSFLQMYKEGKPPSFSYHRKC